MIEYRGFSTKHSRAINNVLRGKDLVIEDLMNHIMTRKGERVMMPTFGSIIHELVFEPLTQETIILVEEDLQYIIDHDPRVKLISMDVFDTEHTINALLRVSIVPSAEIIELNINLERE
jgi:phage baseplate assembly protein W